MGVGYGGLTEDAAVRIRALVEQGAERATIATAVKLPPRLVADFLRGRVEPRPLTHHEHAERLQRMGWEALCMSDDEWQHWLDNNPSVGNDQMFAAWPCMDCPLDFAADMAAQGRCNGIPGAGGPPVEGWTPHAVPAQVPAVRALALVAQQQIEEEPPVVDAVPEADAPQASREIRPLQELAFAAERASAAWEHLRSVEESRADAERDWLRAREALNEWWDEAQEWVAPGTFTPQQASERVLPEPLVAETLDEQEREVLDAYLTERTAEVLASAVRSDIPRNIPDAPAQAAGGGPGRLTSHEERVLASTIAHDGDRKAVAKALGLTAAINVEQALERIAKKGLLPIELIPKLPARFAKYQSLT